jgi:hypothetical protein
MTASATYLQPPNKDERMIAMIKAGPLIDCLHLHESVCFLTTCSFKSVLKQACNFFICNCNCQVEE